MMPPSEADSIPATGSEKRLLKLARKRLERFVTLMPKILVSDDPEIIHDLRVWSRRLQQAIRVILPEPKPPKSKKVIRTLRQVRQTLGPCRNLDVNIALITEKRRHSGAAAVRQSWEAVQRDLEERRNPLLERARNDIAQKDIFAFIGRAKTLIDAAGNDNWSAAGPLQKLEAATAQAMKDCDEACALAYEQRDQTHLHQFRIAAKRLRYRVELLADLGQVKVKPLVEDLKELQNALGDWHDRCVLLQSIAEFIGRPDFLADHPDMGRALLAEMEKEKLRNETAIEQLFQKAATMRQAWAEWKPTAEIATESSPDQ
jgi:CHAD domain-containing protein